MNVNDRAGICMDDIQQHGPHWRPQLVPVRAQDRSQVHLPLDVVAQWHNGLLDWRLVSILYTILEHDMHRWYVACFTLPYHLHPTTLHAPRFAWLLLLC